MDGRRGIWRAAFVSLRIVSVYLIVHALIVAAQYSPFLVSGPGSVRWAVIVAIIVLAAAGAELWLAADGIADRIADRVEDLDDEQAERVEAEEEATPTPKTWIDATSVLSIGFTILGIVIFVDAISGTFVTIGQLISTRSFSGPSTTQYFALAAYALRLAIGLGLALGARGMARALRKLRAPPIDPIEPTEPEP